MDITQYKPKNKELQKYIESFYILTHSKNSQVISYFTFPSLYSIVGSISNAKSTVTAEKVIIEPCSFKSIDTSIVARFNEPICIELRGRIKEVCIYFKPLGLNAFLKKPLSQYSSSIFDKFIPFTDYQQSMKSILNSKENDLIAKKTEAYWFEKLIGFQHSFLFDALEKIEKNPNVSTADLANTYRVSQKTLIKHFKLHLCKTPSQYKKILRFRNALNENKFANKLTEIAYATNFFDQSHMISNFKSLTGFTPKYFFDHISHPEKSNRAWLFVKG